MGVESRQDETPDLVVLQFRLGNKRREEGRALQLGASPANQILL